ncbi:unnamed protein product [Gordionus sp. m RMFG-2023]
MNDMENLYWQHYYSKRLDFQPNFLHIDNNHKVDHLEYSLQAHHEFAAYQYFMSHYCGSHFRYAHYPNGNYQPPPLQIFDNSLLGLLNSTSNWPLMTAHQSYVSLISKAILKSPDRKLVLSDIYQYILDNYPYFRDKGPGWRNSIRHNLSLNECFVKTGRSNNGKGHFWSIHSDNVDDFIRGDFRRKKAKKRIKQAAIKNVYEALVSSSGLMHNKNIVADFSSPILESGSIEVLPKLKNLFWTLVSQARESQMFESNKNKSIQENIPYQPNKQNKIYNLTKKSNTELKNYHSIKVEHQSIVNEMPKQKNYNDINILDDTLKFKIKMSLSRPKISTKDRKKFDIDNILKLV